MMLLMLKLKTSFPARRELMDVLRHAEGPTLSQSGCLGFEVYAGAEEADTVLLLERWSSEPSLHKYIKSDLYRQILAAMELSEVQPEVSCHAVAKTRGMDLIAELREAGIAPQDFDTR